MTLTRPRPRAFFATHQCPEAAGFENCYPGMRAGSSRGDARPGGKMYSRRTLLATLGIGTLAGSFNVLAQQSARKTPRLGILLFNSPQIDPIGPLQEGLKAYGYEDGKTITIDYRFAEGKFERLPDLAEDLVRLKPDVIFAYGGDVAPHAKKATSTIPIVAMVSNDPVQSGLVKSIREPGGNVTGLTLIYDDLAGKMLA